MAGLKVLAGLLLLLAVAHANILVALKHKRLQEMEKLFWEVADANSPLYGKHLSFAELTQLAGTSDNDYAVVESWLKTIGATDVQLLESRDFVTATVPHSVVDAVDANSLYIPDEVKTHIDVVTLQEPPRMAKHTGNEGPFANKWTQIMSADAVGANPVGDPNTQKKAYGIPLTQTGSHPDNSQMVWGTGTFGFLKSDLPKFWSTYKINNDVSLLVTEGSAGTAGGDNFGEGTLDVTYIASMGTGVKTLVANTNTSKSTETGGGFGPALLNFALSLANRKDLPKVISMSLGSLSWDACNVLCKKAAETGQVTYDACYKFAQNERQVCMYESGESAERINVEFMKAGLRGTTILAATGDGGSHFSFGLFNSLSSTGRLLNKISCQYQLPTFPAASPYVLAVGGTQWSQGPNDPVGWTASGGGFSWRFSMPEYQKAAVQKYLASNPLPPASSFNASMRAYPDVACLAVNVPMVIQGRAVNAGGTSASAPAFAGVISLINDLRLKKGLASLGFVNPRLYQLVAEHPEEVLKDITEGRTNCASDGHCCDNGFVAAKGWDPVTGLGRPIWDGMVKYLASD
eukprot:Colp12_sorted_trinity150504_noHs@16960